VTEPTEITQVNEPVIHVGSSGERSESDGPEPVVHVRHARVPASSANLGPGFDSLALALQLYTDISIKPAAQFSITTSGQGSHLFAGPDHFAARIVRTIVGHDRFALHVQSEVPMTRGLGSSAAMAVAAAAVAGHPDPFSYVAGMEGHADNAAAAVLGGLVTGAMVDGHGVAHRLALDPALQFVIVVPDRHLRTAAARKVLPKNVSLADAVFQLGRMGQLIAGMADHRVLASYATDDRLHQRQRATLFPEARPILDAMGAAGALATCWSGAGPTLLAICVERSVKKVVAAAQVSMQSLRVAGSVSQIAPDLNGLVLS
jgi:homoserine kinase